MRYGQGRGNGRMPQVIVGTIHAVKGDEADVVYIFPAVSKDSWKSWCWCSRADASSTWRSPGPGRNWSCSSPRPPGRCRGCDSKPSRRPLAQSQ